MQLRDWFTVISYILSCLYSRTIFFSGVVAFADVTPEGIFQMSNLTRTLHAFNLKTDRRMPCSVDRSRELYPYGQEYITAATFHNGANIYGSVNGMYDLELANH